MNSNLNVRMLTQFEQQRHFMQACGQYTAEYGDYKWNPMAETYKKLVDEEYVQEFLPALEKYRAAPTLENLVALVDGAVDSVYVIYGLLNALGIQYDIHFGIVQNANMAKVDPVTGQVRRREDGKILKPEGWIAPEQKIFEALHESASNFAYASLPSQNVPSSDYGSKEYQEKVAGWIARYGQDEWKERILAISQLSSESEQAWITRMEQKLLGGNSA